MDIDLLSKIVKELILDNDEVTLPGVGSFVAELVPSVFSDKGYTINPPYKRLSFRQKEADDGKLLISFYAKCNNLDMETASKIMHEFLKEMRHILEVKKTILFPGLGKLRATRENCFFFVADEDLDIYPEGFGLEPISLKTHEETPAEVSVTMAALRSILRGEDDAEGNAGKVNANGSDAEPGGKTSVAHDEAETSGDAGQTAAQADIETTEAVTEKPEEQATDSKTAEVTEKAAQSANAEVNAAARNGADDAATAESMAAEAAGISAEAGTGLMNADISAAKQEGTEPSSAAGTISVSEITATSEAHRQKETPVDAGHTDSSETAAEKEPTEKTQKTPPEGQAEATANVEQSETAIAKTAEQTADGKTTGKNGGSVTAETSEQATDSKTAEVTEKAAESANAEVNAAAVNRAGDAATAESMAAEAAGISAEAGTGLKDADISAAKQEGTEPSAATGTISVSEITGTPEIHSHQEGIPAEAVRTDSLETEPDGKIQEDTTEKHLESPASQNARNTVAEAAGQATEKPKKTGWKIFKWIIITLLILAVTALAAFMILAHTAPDFIDSILYTPEELEILNM